MVTNVSSKTLDEKRPYGTLMGVAADGARFVQDGARFDAAGREILAAAKPAKAPKSTPLPGLPTQE